MEVKEKIVDNTNEITNKEISNEVENNQIFKPINETQYNKKDKSDVLIVFGILSFTLILLILITYCIFSLINTKNKNIANNIYIKGINVSGLTKEEAEQKILSYISSCIPEEIKLKHNDFETSVSTSQLSIYFNTKEAVDLAYQIGKNGNIFENNLIVIKSLFSKTNIDPGFSIDEQQLKNSLQDISNKLPDKLIESSCYIDGNNLIITKGKSGKTSYKSG